MDDTTELDYRKAIAGRLKLIMKTIGLEIPGFAVFIEKSESHVYSLLKGRRDLTTEMAKDIGQKLEFDGSKIFKLNYEIPVSIKKSKYLNAFDLKYKTNPEYFINKKIDRKKSYFIEYELLESDLFDKHVYVWEVNERCLELQREYTSDELSKCLNYLVQKGKLISEKRTIKLRSGGFGTRKVDVFKKPG